MISSVIVKNIVYQTEIDTLKKFLIFVFTVYNNKKIKQSKTKVEIKT